MWEEIGQLQFDFLVNRGLKPADSLLDIGCGTLRGGHRFIRYLDAERYTGIDISSEALDAGRRLVEEKGLAAKRPRLLLTRDLKFGNFEGETFKYVLAQSVFTHLPEAYIEECFGHVGQLLGAEGTFYFTYNERRGARQTGLKDFAYPLSFFSGLAAKLKYQLEDVSEQYPHPRGQRMAAVRLLDR